MALVAIVLSGCPVPPAANLDGPDGNEEKTSVGMLALRDVTEGSFVSVSSDIIVDVSGATFYARPERTTVLINGVPLPAVDVDVGSTSVRILPAMDDGRNDIAVYSQDAAGGLLSGAWTVWVGSHDLAVSVLDSQGVPVAGAVVEAILGDDVGVSRSVTTNEDGLACFLNVPARTLLIEAQSATNEVGAVAVAGDAGAIRLELNAFNEASSIDNNDLSKGMDGWDTNDASVMVITDDVPRSADDTKSVANPNLLLTTTGEGPITISRTFSPQPGTSHVGVRYAFVTSEVTGGYYGSDYNDGYSVCIRTSSGGAIVSDSRSMNSFPRSEYDRAGRTAYRELSAPLEIGDSVQIDLTVTNVGDRFNDSSLSVDLIFERTFDIASLNLLDIDNRTLLHLSASDHPYFDGNTRIHGTIRVLGSEGDGIDSLKLNVLHAGQPIATAGLVPEAQSQWNGTFGAGGILEVTAPCLLFELPAEEAALVEATGAESVTLQLEATSIGGEIARREYSAPVGVLVRYADANRYGPRDETMGGDDWARRSVRTFLRHYENDITVGDISNMNGGPFPPHVSHRNGVDVDAWYSGYNARDAAAAETLLRLLNRPGGSRISIVFVTYELIDGDPFWEAIKDVTLSDGRPAASVIRPLNGHTSHFHWVVADQPL